MKLLSFSAAGRSRVGIVGGTGIIDLTAHLGIDDLPAVFSRRAEVEALAGKSGDFGLADVAYLPVVTNPARVFCVGLNYRTHLLETGREPPAHPMIFTRFASSQVGHRQPMLKPRVSDHFDFEGELAVVIGTECRAVAETDAQSVIAGYSAYNDGSIRDWQRHTTQFVPGKNFPRTGGFGPWLVTRDEIADITRSSLVTRLNGEEVQRAVIDDLLFGIPQLIAYCSAFTPLSPGDVIVTGTTGGVGAARKPPLWMKAGDTVEVEIDGIGTLVNPIENE